jgi:CheY-like chemotaxis protein
MPCGDSPRLRAVQRRVLIVEDNRDAREMFRIMLEFDGHEVLEAEEGCAGLQLLRTESPDVAFIDVGLPASTVTKSLGDFVAKAKEPRGMALARPPALRAPAPAAAGLCWWR